MFCKDENRKNILLILTGSIAVYKACELISRLSKADRYYIDVVMSQSAQRFVGTPLIEGLIGKKVHSDMWQPGAALDHIRLVRDADLIVTYPATGNFINKMANGIADSLESSLFLAHDFAKEWWVVPAMNTLMLEHPATQRSLKTLAEWGVRILGTNVGVLACGDVGKGKLLEPAEMFAEIEAHLFGGKHEDVHVVITSGGTVEALDNVRVLTNRSTGTTGALLAERLAQKGVAVSYLCGESAKKPRASSKIKEIGFESAADLQKALMGELRRLDKQKKKIVVVHAAAVSDYSPANGKKNGKISSDLDILTLELKRTPKIVDFIKAECPRVKLVAFKLTCDGSEKSRDTAVDSVFKHSKADVVVHNDTSDWAWGSGEHRFGWIERGEKKSQPVADRRALADKIMGLIESAFKSKG